VNGLCPDDDGNIFWMTRDDFLTLVGTLLVAEPMPFFLKQSLRDHGGNHPVFEQIIL